MQKEAELVEEWKKMKNFGDWLIGHGTSCAEGKGTISHDDKIWEERVGVILVHQAAEILMKAYLVKTGVNIIRGKGPRTIEFLPAFDKINFSGIDRSKFEKFNKVRNEIYHRSSQVPWDKNAEIQNFLVEFKRFYHKAFGNSLDYNTPSIRKKFKEIHK